MKIDSLPDESKKNQNSLQHGNDELMEEVSVGVTCPQLLYHFVR